MAREAIVRRRSGEVEEYHVPFQSHGLGTIALGIALTVVGGGALWLLLVVGWNPKSHPGAGAHFLLVATAGFMALGGLLALVAGAVTCLRPNSPRVLRIDHSKRLIELEGFDPGRFALLIPRLRPPKAQHVISFDELERAGVSVWRHRKDRIETFYISTRKTVYLIGNMSNAPELKQAHDECIAIVQKRRALNRELKFDDAPRPLPEFFAFFMALVVALGVVAVIAWLVP